MSPFAAVTLTRTDLPTGTERLSACTTHSSTPVASRSATSPGRRRAFNQLLYAIEHIYSIAYIAYMAPFQRTQVDVLSRRLNEAPSRIVALFGPRQTGKTTIVGRRSGRYRSRASTWRWTNPTLVPSPLSLISLTGIRCWLPRYEIPTGWSGTGRLPGARRSAPQAGFVLVLDEIQKVPDWSETVKGLWDADRARECPLHVVILGSAPLLLQSGLSESLAGRFEPLRVAHWSFPEMSRMPSISPWTNIIYFGGYPGAAPLVRDQDRWRDYVLQGLVQSEHRAGHPGHDPGGQTRALLRRLFELGAEYSGQILSYNKMLGQLTDAGNTTTLARYLDLLASAGLLARLAQSFQPASPPPGIQPQAQRPEHRPDDRRFRLLVRRGSGRTAPSGGGWWRAPWARISTALRRRTSPCNTDGRTNTRLTSCCSEVTQCRRHRGQERSCSVADTSGMAEFEKQFSPIRSLVVGADGIPLNEFLSEPAEHWFEAA